MLAPFDLDLIPFPCTVQIIGRAKSGKSTILRHILTNAKNAPRYGFTDDSKIASSFQTKAHEEIQLLEPIIQSSCYGPCQDCRGLCPVLAHRQPPVESDCALVFYRDFEQGPGEAGGHALEESESQYLSRQSMRCRCNFALRCDDLLRSLV